MAARLIRQLVLGALIIAAAAPASAQMAQPTLRPSRPARGLFGGGTADTEQSLALNLSLGGGRDWDRSPAPLVPPGSPALDPPFYVGAYGSASGTLSYTVARERIGGGASIGGSTRYNPQRGGTTFGSLGAGAHFSAQLSTRSSVSVTQSISYQPHNLQQLFGSWLDPGSAPSSLMDLSGAIVAKSRFLTHSAAGFSYGITSRLSVTSNYSHQIIDAFSGDPATGSTTQNAGVGLSLSIARGVSLRGGYSQSRSRFGQQDPVSYGGPTADGGLSFDRALSLTRRTRFGFGTGVSGARDEAGNLRYFLTGRANLSYEIGRSWTAALNYRRGVDFSQGFRLPVVLDTASAGVSGDIGRRLQFTGGGGASMGEIGVGPGQRGFTMIRGYTSLRTAIGRNLAVTVSYNYNHYRFDDPSSLPLGWRPETERHGVRASLDVWIPLFMRARRADAAR